MTNLSGLILKILINEISTLHGDPRRSKWFAATLVGDLDKLHINRTGQQRRDRHFVEDAVNEVSDAGPDRLQPAVVVMHAGVLIPGELRANFFFRRNAAEHAHHFAERNLTARTGQAITTLRPA